MMCFPSGQEKLLKFYDFLPYSHRPFVSTQEDEAFSSADSTEVTTEQEPKFKLREWSMAGFVLMIFTELNYFSIKVWFLAMYLSGSYNN